MSACIHGTPEGNLCAACEARANTGPVVTLEDAALALREAARLAEANRQAFRFIETEAGKLQREVDKARLAWSDANTAVERAEAQLRRVALEGP